MHLIITIVTVILVLFAFVILFGAPYLPTMRPQIAAAFELLGLPEGATILELGSGDGRVLLAAAKAGYQAVGIELNPILYVLSVIRTWPHRKHIKVIWGNFWTTPWPEADAVFVFLLDRFMPKLDSRMQEYKKPLVSIAFKIPNRSITAENAGVFRYDYR